VNRNTTQHKARTEEEKNRSGIKDNDRKRRNF
jgi:hypothetical protein